VARIELPEMRARADIVRFDAAVWSPTQVGLDLYFVNEGSSRVIQRGYVATSTGYTLIR
jgi:hypothetical protein